MEDGVQGKRVCFVTNSFSAGGAEKVISILANYLASEAGLNLHLIVFGPDRTIYYDLHPSITIHTPHFKFKPQFRAIYGLRTMIFLREKIKRINPYRVISFGEYWNNFVLLSLLGTSQSIVVSDRSQPDKSLGFFHNQLRKLLYPSAYAVIAQTQYAKEVYKKLYSHNQLVVLGNPINENYDQPSNRSKIVLSVGRLIKSKNFDKLIQTFLQIGEPDWKLYIIGDDHLGQDNREMLLRMIEQSNSPDRIVLLRKQKDITKYYLMASIFAFMSESEGFPNVIGEAMASGLPVVAFDCSAGPSEMIKDGENGFLVPLYNYQLFGDRLKLLMKDSSQTRKFGDQAKLDIRQFSPQVIGEKFHTIIMAKQIE